MKKIIATFFAVAMLVAMPALAQDLQKGLEAYERGDYAIALKEWKALAEQGHPHAQYLIGFMYRNGDGVLQNYIETEKWYRKAAKQGFLLAQANLGGMYYYGYGVPQDHTEAAKWFRKAAVQGSAGAQMVLGAMYFRGEGVLQNNISAYVWTNIATFNGDENAKMTRDIIVQALGTNELNEAQALAEKCLESNYRDCP